MITDDERPSLFQRFKDFFKGKRVSDFFFERPDGEDRRDIRAFITIDGKTEVLGEYRGITPDELDALTQQDQANYTFKLMLKTKQPKAVLAQITIEEMK